MRAKVDTDFTRQLRAAARFSNEKRSPKLSCSHPLGSQKWDTVDTCDWTDTEEKMRKEVYETFLEAVCETTEYFEDIENIIKRYETLEATNSDLKQRVDYAQVEAEEQVHSPAPCGLLAVI